ncbi:MAG: hypothetical protein V1701_06850 [Planctomycetota bacterium]
MKSIILLSLIGLLFAVSFNTIAEEPSPPQDISAFGILNQCAKDNKYLFVFFFKNKDNPAASKMAEVFSKAKVTYAEKASFIEINIDNPVEEKFIKQFEIDKKSKPIIIAIAPEGVVTKECSMTATQEELGEAFATPKTLEMLKAHKDNKYFMVLFFKDKADANTVVMSDVFNKAKVTYSDKAVFTEINIADKSEERFISRFEVDKVAKPLILAIAPGEIVTKGFIKKVKEEQIAEAFVTPKTLETLRANKDKKMIVMLFNNPKLEGSNKAEAIVNSVAKEMSVQTPMQVIIVDPSDAAEKDLLARAGVSANIKKPAVVILQDGTLKGTIEYDKLTADALKALITKSCGADCGPGG